jgi:hypothetical protein
MDEAHRAWYRAPGNPRRVCFTWRRRTFFVHASRFRLLVDDSEGRAVACRYH